MGRHRNIPQTLAGTKSSPRTAAGARHAEKNNTIIHARLTNARGEVAAAAAVAPLPASEACGLTARVSRKAVARARVTYERLGSFFFLLFLHPN